MHQKYVDDWIDNFLKANPKKENEIRRLEE